MKIKKIILITLGCISLGVGCVGIALPILPTTPFFLLTLFCFTNSSERLHNWFVGTKLYKKHLESFVQKRGMTVVTKVSIIVTFTLVMALGFIMMKKVFIGRICLAAVWVVHIVYFVFIVKTIRINKNTEDSGGREPDVIEKDA
ncbi:MAG: YbaN family protein [Treponema sp.]